jgi:hypothetical protein
MLEREKECLIEDERDRVESESVWLLRVSFDRDVLYGLVGIPGTWHEQCVAKQVEENK